MTTTKVTLGLPDIALDYLKAEAARRGISMADAVRSAIETDRIVRTKSNSGADVLIAEPGKTTAKLLLP